MYSLFSYGQMILDEPRMDAYAAALEKVVGPDSVVLDIGTGTGIHALLAARLGARRVHAVELSDAVTLGPRLARENGVEDIVHFVQDRSTRIELPERADVVVSDLHGTLPWYGQAIPTLVDARRRLMREGGVLIPQSDRVWIVPVEAPALFARHAEPWTVEPRGVRMDAVLEHTMNAFSRGRVGREGFLADPTLVTEIDYRTVDDPNVAIQTSFRVKRDGVLHGFLIWFDTRVLGDIEISSAPWKPEISYGSAFFPVLRSVDVGTRDWVDLEWAGSISGDSYIWQWGTRVATTAGEARAEFRQNSFRSALLSLKKLRKRAPDHRPTLDERGQVDQAVLGWMDGSRSLEQIAELLTEVHPGVFDSADQAMDRVRELSEEYG